MRRMTRWKGVYLTLRYTGYFLSFRHNSCSSNTIEILKHFLGLGQSSYPCDQIHMKIGPNQTFLLKLWSFKVAGGGHNDHPPCNVGLSGHNLHWYLIFYIGAGRVMWCASVHYHNDTWHFPIMAIIAILASSGITLIRHICILFIMLDLQR